MPLPHTRACSSLSRTPASLCSEYPAFTLCCSNTLLHSCCSIRNQVTKNIGALCRDREGVTGRAPVPCVQSATVVYSLTPKARSGAPAHMHRPQADKRAQLDCVRESAPLSRRPSSSRPPDRHDHHTQSEPAMIGMDSQYLLFDYISSPSPSARAHRASLQHSPPRARLLLLQQAPPPSSSSSSGSPSSPAPPHHQSVRVLACSRWPLTAAPTVLTSMRKVSWP